MDWGQLAITIAAFALKAAFYLVFFVAMLILTIKLCFRKINRERRKLAGFQLDDIDRMSGEAFEEYLGVLFDRLGYLSIPTERFDKGADLILVKEGVRTAVQAKCWTRERVDVEAIRAVVAAQRPYRCTRGLVVTNNYFTRPAAQTAKDNNIELWDRDDLANVILTLNNPGQPLPIPSEIAWLLDAPRTAPVATLQSPPPASDFTCAECGRQLTKGVRQYCLDQPDRFGGRIYCMDHQRRASTAHAARRTAEAAAAD